MLEAKIISTLAKRDKIKINKVFFILNKILLLYNIKYTKKAGLHCCCSAIRGSGIAFDSEQATPSPRRYVQIRTRIITAYTDMDIHIPRTSKCCNVLESMKFTRFRIAKHKALMKHPINLRNLSEFPYLTPLLCL